MFQPPAEFTSTIWVFYHFRAHFLPVSWKQLSRYTRPLQAWEQKTLHLTELKSFLKTIDSWKQLIGPLYVKGKKLPSEIFWSILVKQSDANTVDVFIVDRMSVIPNLKEKQDQTEEKRRDNLIENKTGIPFRTASKYGIQRHIRKWGFLCMFREAW